MWALETFSPSPCLAVNNKQMALLPFFFWFFFLPLHCTLIFFDLGRHGLSVLKFAYN